MSEEKKIEYKHFSMEADYPADFFDDVYRPIGIMKLQNHCCAWEPVLLLARTVHEDNGETRLLYGVKCGGERVKEDREHKGCYNKETPAEALEAWDESFKEWAKNIEATMGYTISEKQYICNVFGEGGLHD